MDLELIDNETSLPIGTRRFNGARPVATDVLLHEVGGELRLYTVMYCRWSEEGNLDVIVQEVRETASA